ncbi:MAG: hypothetical protein ACJA0Y_001433 [Maricaulis maris]|jgi:hypothetical protein
MSDRQSLGDFEEWVEIGRDLVFAALIAGSVDREPDNPLGALFGMAMGVSEALALLTCDDRAGSKFLRALAMPGNARGRAQALQKLMDAAMAQIDSGTTILSEFEKGPATESRRMAVLGRVIERLIPQDDAFSLLHGPFDGEDLDVDRMFWMTSSHDKGAWGRAVAAVLMQEAVEVALTQSADKADGVQ